MSSYVFFVSLKMLHGLGFVFVVDADKDMSHVCVRSLAFSLYSLRTHSLPFYSHFVAALCVHTPHSGRES